MRKEDVKKVLPGVLAGNGEDAKLIEWCKEHLPSVLKSAGIHKWIPPYYAQVSDYTEQYHHTWESGQSAMLTRSYMDVFESDKDTFIGRLPISSFKSKVAICETIKRDDKWYLLTADSRVKIYSLPDLELVAQTEQQCHGKIFDIWCPRLHSELEVYNSAVDGEEHAFYYCALDDDIEEDQEWESALFAFVDSYDPYCSGPDYVRILDLRDFTNGVIKEQFLMEKPNHLNLRQGVHVEHWTKEWPSVYIAKEDCISTVDIAGPGPCGWEEGQLEYFKWAGEVEDPRTSKQVALRKSIEWAHHPDCLFLSDKLGVKYERKYEHVNSKEDAKTMAVKDPNRLKSIVLHNFRNGAIFNSAWAIYGLAYLEPSDDIRDALRYIAKKGKHKEFRSAAKEAMLTAYPEDALMKRFTRWVGGLGK